ncbi:MAG TPA: sigma-70 family RNA polymerase sigma factor [Mycobacteriales bacterium]|nr:sigma-70 family RNA polymerase sigma factor [Mycobacteriales bacterium]
METADVAACLERARRGDRPALDELLGQLRPAVYRYCLARLRDPYAADDATQEVILAVAVTLPRYEDRGQPFAAFVFGVAANKVLEAHRRGRRRREESLDGISRAPTEAKGPEEQAVLGEEAARLLALIDALPDTQRGVLLLRVAAGLSAEETAATLGMTSGAVRVAQHRALARVRALAAEQPI